jgi:ABC-2 type transport system permease protein
VIAVYRWEVAKLLAQKRTYLGLFAATAIPLVFVTVLLLKSGGPNDALLGLGSRVRDTGLVVPFVVLFFMSFWAFPLIASLVAGDIVASETQNGTLKTILTRSRGRGAIFGGKVLATLTYLVAAVVAMATAGTVAGTIAWGFNRLPSPSGPTVSAWHGLWLLVASAAIYLLPLAGVAAFAVLLSTVTRNSAAAVVGALMWSLAFQVINALPGTESIRPYLLSVQFDAWHGLLRVPADWAPVEHALWVCALYVAVPLAVAAVVFLRRDVAGE